MGGLNNSKINTSKIYSPSGKFAERVKKLSSPTELELSLLTAGS